MLHLGVKLSFVWFLMSLPANLWTIHGLMLYVQLVTRVIIKNVLDSARGQLETTNGSSKLTLTLCGAALCPFNPQELQFLQKSAIFGGTAHAVKLHEFDMFSRQKQHAKRSLPIKQFPGKAPVSSAGWNPGEIQSERWLTQFFGQRGNSVIFFTPAPVTIPLTAANYFTVPQREVAFPQALKPSRVGDGAPQHPKDTAGLTLAPISPDPFLDLKNNNKKI